MANKYGAKSREIDGHEFPSLKEASYYLRYKDMLKHGEIIKLELQPKFTLIPSFKGKDGKTERSVCYTADFRLTYPGGCVVVVEVKGYKTRDYVLRRKMFKWFNRDVDFIEV
jgi:hypothetical protein